ncbi:MAG: hypothetical protein MSG64_02360 [Pyrinomonadaceae bacterium MAG19_C2-C3]|nr:hypothetical protein [Pyrinomonadaceae bacterium MAG19_C2-C3]
MKLTDTAHVNKTPYLAFILMLIVWLSCAPTFAQKNRRARQTAKPKPSAAQTAKAARQKELDALIAATENYKKQASELVALYEVGLKRVEAEAAKQGGLYAEGLISKSALTEAQNRITTARAQLEATQARITEADNLLAEASIPDEPEPLPASVNSSVPNSTSSAATRFLTVRTVAYFYSPGRGSWTLAEAASIQNFFRARFNRNLPVSAFGQTATHNQLGFAHFNAMDVSLHPDSTEGRAVIEFLIARNIPFFAFRRAVSGSATGAHIHIGTRSRRFAAR